MSGGKKWTDDENVMATDVAKILVFLADFLHHPNEAHRRIQQLIAETGEETGLDRRR
ncbi:MAG: hypothetical protein IPG11_17580 [Flavobacteriales bacterium]|nr:hypothetical protein [Flavobacteriales bacterium]